jgi:hypothetical protein
MYIMSFYILISCRFPETNTDRLYFPIKTLAPNLQRLSMIFPTPILNQFSMGDRPVPSTVTSLLVRLPVSSIFRALLHLQQPSITSLSVLAVTAPGYQISSPAGLAGSFPNLTRLSYKGVDEKWHNGNGDTVWSGSWFLKEMKCLQRLELSGWRFLTLFSDLQCYNTLQEVNLGPGHYEDFKGLSQCQNLKVFQYEFDSIKILAGETHWQSLANGLVELPNLETFIIRRSPDDTDETGRGDVYGYRFGDFMDMLLAAIHTRPFWPKLKTLRISGGNSNGKFDKTTLILLLTTMNRETIFDLLDVSGNKDLKLETAFVIELEKWAKRVIT